MNGSSATYRQLRLIWVMLLALGLLGSVTVHLSAQEFLFDDYYLFNGQSIRDRNCRFRLKMQSDGNLVLYDQSRPLWASNTVGRIGYAVMQSDGNFVMYNWNGQPFWSTNTYGYPHAYLAMQRDGNLVVYREYGRPVWATGTAVGEAFATTSCESSATIVEHNIDRPGGDYVWYRMETPNFKHCAYWCSQDSRCRAFTYVPPGVQESNARCWLKDRIPAYSSRTGMVSGQIRR